MGTGTAASRIGFRIAIFAILVVWLAGCGAVALVDAAATVTGQAVKTTGKATGTAARATIGGARAAGRVAVKPFRKREPAKSADDE